MVYLKICLSEWKCLFMKKLPSCVVRASLQFSLRTEGAHIFYIQFRYRKVI